MKKTIAAVLQALLCLTAIFIAVILATQIAIAQPKAATSLSLPKKFTAIHNKKNVTLTDAQFKGKYILIDFFGTWCKACIRSLPHMDSLQQMFGDKLQIFVVSKQPTASLQSFLSKRAYPNLIFIGDDNYFSPAFPYQSLPHEVIIDPNGKVLRQTTESALTFDNVQRILTTGDADFMPVKQNAAGFSTSYTLLKNLEKSPQVIRSMSVLSAAFPGIGAKAGNKKDSVYVRYFWYNHSLLEMLLFTYGRSQEMPYILEVADTTAYIHTKENWQTWYIDHAYCYEITVPAATSYEEVQRLMRADLESRFRLSTRLVPGAERTSFSTLIISETNPSNK